MLVQHYFTVPLHMPDTDADAMMQPYACFEVVCVADEANEDEDPNEAPPRQRPLLAVVDFGHAVWLKQVRAAGDEEDEEPYERGQKRLRFIWFPGIMPEGEGHAVRGGIGDSGSPDGLLEMEGAAWMLSLPKELNLHKVETIDQS